MQHVEEVAHLRNVRSVLVRAPHVELHRMARLDERLAGHLGGLALAGRFGSRLCTAALERPDVGRVFAAALCALDERDDAALDRLLALSAVLPDARRGLLSAFGWMSASNLRGIVSALLVAADESRRELALSACRLHRVDPGSVLTTALREASPSFRASALRAAGELGRIDLRDQALAASQDPTTEIAYFGAAAACLLGDRGAALSTLQALAREQGTWRDRALLLALCASDFERGRDIVHRLALTATSAPEIKRLAVRAFGWLGDTQALPWIIESMADGKLARVAGEAFMLITGASSDDIELAGPAPRSLEGGPSDDPSDDSVEIGEDESSPWPDRDRAERWWQARAPSMQSAACLFMGAPPSLAHCIGVLRTGCQRQRAIAALRICLERADRPLFNIYAPSWRQQRELSTS